jgi:ATP-dependent 26S proteasome regulatory subunit
MYICKYCYALQQMSPTIVFIDEIDAVGSKRYDSNSGGTREIQRTMLELLNQLDGFDERGDVKVIMATNRIESLDPALIRPGRIDRKIEFPLPDIKTKRRIFGIHTGRMTLNDVSSTSALLFLPLYWGPAIVTAITLMFAHTIRNVWLIIISAEAQGC